MFQPALWFMLSVSMFTWLNPSSLTMCSLSGLLLMVGLMLYPAGWGSEKVISYCGLEASPFRPFMCSLGWAFYAAIGGTLATFLCAVLSAQAEIATSSDKVQEEIEEGKSLICLLWAFEIENPAENHPWSICLDVDNCTSQRRRTDTSLEVFPLDGLDKRLLKRFF